MRYVVVGGAAMVLHGSAYVTHDLDICYDRERINVENLVNALKPLNPKLRVARSPEPLPLVWDSRTILNGLHFTLTTSVGSLDLFGSIDGLGPYSEVVRYAKMYRVAGHEIPLLGLEGLVIAKRAAGRKKDLLALPELEAMLEAERVRERMEREN